MAGFDYGKITDGFLGGLEAGQRFRANRQAEKARDQALELGSYEIESARANRRIRDPESTQVLGELDPASVQDYQGLEDPFALRLFDFFANRRKRKQAQGRQALALPQSPEDVGPSAAYAGPSASAVDGPTLVEPPLPEYADGGQPDLSPEMVKKLRAQVQDMRVDLRTNNPELADEAEADQGTDRGALSFSDKLAANRADNEVYMRSLGRRLTGQTDKQKARAQQGKADTDAYLFGERGPPVPSRGVVPAPRAALPLQKSPAAAAPAAPAAAAVPQLAQGAAPRGAPAAAAQPDANVVNFGELDIEPSEVPNMQMDDWKKYRAKLMDAARLSGRPERVAQVNDMVTGMQQKGFLNYGQQGLALQQAGNVKGAMAAYRAAFQYFPNGNDVEFGIMKDRRTGRPQIVGFGKDEKTGKVVPGTELVMDPERVATMIENFKNPNAFRAWTKDWRDEQFKERSYQEVTKPLAQAQVTASANNSEANILRAENSMLRSQSAGRPTAAVTATNLRNAERVFRDRLGMMGLQDEQQADYLASVMSQVKAKNPGVPDNTIVDAIMKAQADGSLAQRLQKMGIQ